MAKQIKQAKQTEPVKPTKVIPREQAVFRMDGKGVWHNEYGPFEHPKIIQYFNRSIQHDDQGFFLLQEMETAFEKVYFPYEQTAFFVADVSGKDPRALMLNTGEKMCLDPDRLFVCEDSLFVRMAEYLIKFTPRALLKLSKYMKEEQGALMLVLGEGTWSIPEDPDIPEDLEH